MTKTRLIAVPLVLIAAAAIWLHTPSRIDAATGDPLLDAFLLIESGSVADAIEQLYGKRAHMTSDLQPLFPTKFVGRAVTVQMKKEEHTEGVPPPSKARSTRSTRAAQTLSTSWISAKAAKTSPPSAVSWPPP